jgi:hypothetical protein
MNTRLLQGIAVALLTVFVLARPAAAQEEAEADTIYVTGDKTIVIVGDEGHRVIVRSADDLDWPHIVVDDHLDGPRTFSVRPGEWRAPRVMFRGNAFDDEDEAHNFTVFSDYFDQFGNAIAGGFGDDFAFRLRQTAQEREELMRMEMESQRLARRARRAEGDERAQLEQELQDQLNDIFDRKQVLREKRVEQLREALNKALDQQNDREQNRNEIVDRRLRELLGQHDRYDW